MIVRPAVVGDAAALAAVARRAITITAAARYDADQIAAWAGSFTSESLAAVVESTSVFVVDHEHETVGFANLLVTDAGRAEVDLLYVDPGLSRRGVARLALDAVEAEARRRGVDTLFADASLLAAPVLEHLGYVVVERYEKARGAVSFPNTWLAKPLT